MKSNRIKSSSTFQPAAFLATFSILFPLWLVMSGMFDRFHISAGVICCALVAFLSHDLLFPRFQLGEAVGIAYRFTRYIPWLFYQIILANIHVATIALKPQMPLDPSIIQFKPKLTKDLALVTLSNSITLTPGTITMDIRDGTYFVHSIDPAVAEDLLSGKEMETRVAFIYQDGEFSKS
jgi:multicomponent Na+:H+ antiporter subunit E